MFHASMEVVGAAELVRVHAKTAMDTTNTRHAIYMLHFFVLKSDRHNANDGRLVLLIPLTPLLMGKHRDVPVRLLNAID